MSIRCLFCVVALAAAPAIHAAEEATPDERFVLTISGGISLGAYDSGRNWVILRDLHRASGWSATE